MDNFLTINTIAELHEMLNIDQPNHPYISITDFPEIPPNSAHYNIPFRTNFYVINYIEYSTIPVFYGHNYYRIDPNSLVFFSPGQIFLFEGTYIEDCVKTRQLNIHPELFRGSFLSNKISEYSFFSYQSHQSLNVSEEEKTLILDLIQGLDDEISREVSPSTDEVIVAYIYLLLTQGQRIYERQPRGQHVANYDYLAKFESLLNSALSENNIRHNGLPNVNSLAAAMGYTPNYLTNLLKQDTGMTTIEHIHAQLIRKAKDKLIWSNSNIGKISEELGFAKPASFSKFFRSHVGYSPSNYVKAHNHSL